MLRQKAARFSRVGWRIQRLERLDAYHLERLCELHRTREYLLRFLERSVYYVQKKELGRDLSYKEQRLCNC